MKRLRHGYVLGAIMMLYVLVIALPVALFGALKIAILLGMLTLIVHDGRRDDRFGRPIRIIALAFLIATFVVTFTGPTNLKLLVSQFSTVILVTASIWLLGRNVLQRAVVDLSVISGVLSIYLLIALLFATIADIGAVFQPHFLDGASVPPTSSDTLYFSLITLTTTGFGDITPGTDVARAAAAAEAVLGQLFLVSVVAAVVSRYRRPGRPVPEGSEPLAPESPEAGTEAGAPADTSSARPDGSGSGNSGSAGSGSAG